jgi:cysteine desulfurase
MGLSEADARGALRITMGHTTTVDEIDALVAALPSAVSRAGRAGLSDRVVDMGLSRTGAVTAGAAGVDA